MTDKELIKQEIERLYAEVSQKPYNGEVEGEMCAYDKLISFIDSLTEESTSEDLEEEIDRYYSDWQFDDDTIYEDMRNICRHFAEWQKNKMNETLQTEYEKGRFDMREEMMKILIGGEVVKDIHNQLSVKSEPLNDAFGDIKFDDKVKIIIVKED